MKMRLPLVHLTTGFSVSPAAKSDVADVTKTDISEMKIRLSLVHLTTTG